METPELWDVLDVEGQKTGRVAVRGQTLPLGDYHLVVHVWLRDSEGNYLIQKRADHLDWRPGIWAATGGSVLAGEDSLQGAIRETREELGIDLHPEQMVRLVRLVKEPNIVDIWLATGEKEQWDDPELGPEVSLSRWVSESEIRQMVQSGEFHRYRYLNMLLGMSVKWPVCTATMGDLDRWLAFLQIVQPEFHNLDLVHDANHLAVVEKNIRRGTAIFVQRGTGLGEIVGAMMYSPNQQHISWLAVHPDYRRQGIGSALVEHMFRMLTEADAFRVKTFLQADAQGPAARSFYEKHGFMPKEIMQDEHNENAGHPFQIFTKVVKRSTSVNDHNY